MTWFCLWTPALDNNKNAIGEGTHYIYTKYTQYIHALYTYTIYIYHVHTRKSYSTVIPLLAVTAVTASAKQLQCTSVSAMLLTTADVQHTHCMHES